MQELTDLFDPVKPFVLLLVNADIFTLLSLSLDFTFRVLPFTFLAELHASIDRCVAINLVFYVLGVYLIPCFEFIRFYFRFCFFLIGCFVMLLGIVKVVELLRSRKRSKMLTD